MKKKTDFRYPIKNFNKDKNLILHNIKLSLGSLNLIQHYLNVLYSYDEDFCFCVDDCNVIRDYYERLLGVIEPLEYSDVISSEKSD